LSLPSGTLSPLDLSRGRDDMIAEMNNDLNTPAVLATLHTMAGMIINAAHEGRDVSAAQAMVRDLALMLGFTLR